MMSEKKLFSEEERAEVRQLIGRCSDFLDNAEDAFAQKMDTMGLVHLMGFTITAGLMNDRLGSLAGRLKADLDDEGGENDDESGRRERPIDSSKASSPDAGHLS